MTPVGTKLALASARDRLLKAATHAFAVHGFEGSTTRLIAQNAGVNEVTLFRLFQTKENLQAAVLQRAFDQQAELLAAQPRQVPSAGLHAELLRIACNYRAALRQNIVLIRTMIGEIHRHPAHEKEVLQGILDPLRLELLAALEAARRDGAVRPGLDPQIAVAMLSAVILIDTLKRSMDPRHVPAYSAEAHLAACLQTFVRGIAA